MRHGTRTLYSSHKPPPLHLGNILLSASLTKTLSESGTRNLDPQSIPISEPLVLQVLAKNSLDPSKKLDFFRWCHSLGPFYKHNACTYSHIFRTVCKAGFLEEVPGLLNSMKEDRVVVDSDTFKILLDAFIKSGKFDSALEILDYMEELGTSLNPRMYDSVLVALIRKNQVGLALSIFSKLLDACNGSVNDTSVVESLPGSFACNELLVALKKSDMRVEFKQVFDKLTEKTGFEFDTCGYNICIHAFGCWGDLDTSLRLFKEMKEKSLVRGSFDPDLCTYNSLIQVLCFVGKVKDALIVWEELKVSGHEPDEFTYRNLIQGCCKSYRMDDAMKVFNEMQYNGFVPNTVVYNSLLDGMFKARKVTEACQLFEKMVQDGVRTSCWTYNILIDGLFRNGRAEAGYTLFCDLKKKGQFVDAITFSIVVLQLCREGHLEEAIQLVEEMEGRGYVVDLVTITSLLIGFHNHGRWDWTERLMKHVRDVNLVPNVLKWKAEIEVSMKRKSKKKDYTPMFPTKDIREIMNLMGSTDSEMDTNLGSEDDPDLASSVLDKLMKQDKLVSRVKPKLTAIRRKNLERKKTCHDFFVISFFVHIITTKASIDENLKLFFIIATLNVLVGVDIALNSSPTSLLQPSKLQTVWLILPRRQQQFPAEFVCTKHYIILFWITVGPTNLDSSILTPMSLELFYIPINMYPSLHSQLVGVDGVERETRINDHVSRRGSCPECFTYLVCIPVSSPQKQRDEMKKKNDMILKRSHDRNHAVEKSGCYLEHSISTKPQLQLLNKVIVNMCPKGTD
ncbi:hypothetical protein EZV62_010141 [Acer yangbiense]|uniref:Pentacotripeptide-repeat region of PRORP domain-containing protein n=1 Tax=Acer yangbiense TaxID=1000413 RepID=A0A5C7I1I3_9ROSI|nr:hypothetical protein EZV62_010141 [Acer yangbiense]